MIISDGGKLFFVIYSRNKKPRVIGGLEAKPRNPRGETFGGNTPTTPSRIDESLRIVPEVLWNEIHEKANAVGNVWPMKKGRSFFKGQNLRELLFPSHLLSGLVFCKYCDGAMSFVSGKKGGYFGCLAATKKTCSKRNLVQLSIVEESVQQFL